MSTEVPNGSAPQPTGFIERLKQEAESKELEQQAQQAKLAEAKALHNQRKDQATAYRAEGRDIL